VSGLRRSSNSKRLIDRTSFYWVDSATNEEKTVKNGIPQLSPKDLKRRIDAGEDLRAIA
jgi:hypothetical protein